MDKEPWYIKTMESCSTIGKKLLIHKILLNRFQNMLRERRQSSTYYMIPFELNSRIGKTKLYFLRKINSCLRLKRNRKSGAGKEGMEIFCYFIVVVVVTQKYVTVKIHSVVHLD